MISQDTLVYLVTHFGLFIIFPLAIIEGPIIGALAGYMLHLASFTWWQALLVIVLADLVGDTFLYRLGMISNSVTGQKWRKRLKVSDEQIAKLEAQFANRGGVLILLGKFLHFPGLAVLVSAGIAKMNYVKFLFFLIS